MGGRGQVPGVAGIIGRGRPQRVHAHGVGVKQKGRQEVCKW